MAAEQITKVDVTQVTVVLLDQLELSADHVLPVLEGELGEVIEHGDDSGGRDLMVPFQVIEQADQIAGLACENATAVSCLS